MFRHPRIERGTSGQGHLGDKTQRIPTPLTLDAEAASYSTVGSMNKTSHEAPLPGKACAEGITCASCHQSFTTKEGLQHHAEDCEPHLRSLRRRAAYRKFRPSNELGEHTTVRSPITSNVGQSGRVYSSSFQGATGTAKGRDDDSNAEPQVEKREEWSAIEDCIMIELRLKGLSWLEISRFLPGRSPKSCHGRFQEESVPQDRLALLFPTSNLETWDPTRDQPQNPPPFGRHDVTSCSDLKAVDNSNPGSEGEVLHSFLRVVSTPENNFISRAQSISGEPGTHASDFAMEDARRTDPNHVRLGSTTDRLTEVSQKMRVRGI